MRISISVLVSVVSLTFSTAFADQDDVRRLFLSGEILSLEQIVGKLQKQHPGKILDAELEEKKGLLIYELEILDRSGVVWEYKLNARTGEIIEREQDD